MNLSGIALKACVDFFSPRVENILVVHDDLDLPLGRVKVIQNGGAGGHKGVLSIFEHLGTRDFNRLKVGIGRSLYMEPVEEFVLSPFNFEERPLIEKVIPLAVEACRIFVTKGVKSAMTRINCQDLGETAEAIQ
jgi:PTH1 family peptidyl-tRNA hydrolase